MTDTDREALRRLMHPNDKKMTETEYRNSPKRRAREQARQKAYDTHAYDGSDPDASEGTPRL